MGSSSSDEGGGAVRLWFGGSQRRHGGGFASERRVTPGGDGSCPDEPKAVGLFLTVKATVLGSGGDRRRQLCERLCLASGEWLDSDWTRGRCDEQRLESEIRRGFAAANVWAGGSPTMTSSGLMMEVVVGDFTWGCRRWDSGNESGRGGDQNRCVILNAKEAQDKHLALVHTKNHIDLIKNISSISSDFKRKKIAADFNSIYFNQGSSEAAYLAAGSVIEVAEKVAKGELNSAFAIVRPPGHHAEHDQPMGFCLHNNVAVATSYLLNERRDLGINKILIVDWDVHHGNGTQKMFYDDPRVLFFSVHRYDNATFFPCTHDGSYIMTGEDQGAGYNINVPWGSGRRGDADYNAVWDQILIPAAKEYNPDLIVISAGFDAATGDPLGGCFVSPYGFSILLEKLMKFAGGKIVMALEGGYNLKSIANSAHACVEVLLQGKCIAGSLKAKPFKSTLRVIEEVRQILSTYWPVFAGKSPDKVISRTSPLETSTMAVTQISGANSNSNSKQQVEEAISELTRLRKTGGDPNHCSDKGTSTMAVTQISDANSNSNSNSKQQVEEAISELTRLRKTCGDPNRCSDKGTSTMAVTQILDVNSNLNSKQHVEEAISELTRLRKTGGDLNRCSDKGTSTMAVTQISDANLNSKQQVEEAISELARLRKTGGDPNRCSNKGTSTMAVTQISDANSNLNSKQQVEEAISELTRLIKTGGDLNRCSDKVTSTMAVTQISDANSNSSSKQQVEEAISELTRLIKTGGDLNRCSDKVTSTMAVTQISDANSNSSSKQQVEEAISELTRLIKTGGDLNRCSDKVISTMAVTRISDANSNSNLKQQVEEAISELTRLRKSGGDLNRCSDKGLTTRKEGILNLVRVTAYMPSKNRKRDYHDSLSDIDDAEVARYLNTKEAINYKRILWEALNRNYTQSKKQKRTTGTKKGTPVKRYAKIIEKVEIRKQSTKINYDALKLLED